jgi:hypothetical protein
MLRLNQEHAGASTFASRWDEDALFGSREQMRIDRDPSAVKAAASWLKSVPRCSDNHTYASHRRLDAADAAPQRD